MKEIGILLRNYIEKSGYTIYGIAKAAGINRSTLQKVLLENRKPSPQFMAQLLPHLKLSPDERDNLLTTVEFMTSGKTLYNQRVYIKQMLEYVADVLYGNDVHSVRLVSTGLPDIPYGNTQLFQGGFAVEKAVNTLMEYEAHMKSPLIRINVPGNAKLISNTLMHALYYCANCHALDIRHLLYLAKSDTGHKLTMENLEILSNIAPFICATDFKYQASYRYADSGIRLLNMQTAFPYSITGTSWCLLISHDCATAMYCDLSETIRYLNLQFESAWEHTTPFSSTCTTVEDVFPLFIHMNQQDFPCITLEYQPCLPAYLTEEMVQTYARPDMPDYESIVQQVLFRTRQLQNLTMRSYIFTKSGLEEFTHTGCLSDFPPEYAYPFQPEDRIRLLECLYEEIASDKQVHRIVNPVNFSVLKHFNYFVTKSRGLVFMGYNDSRRDFDYVLIQEPSLIDAFFDFSQYLIGSSYVYSKEDTLAVIRQCIHSLG